MEGVKSSEEVGVKSEEVAIKFGIRDSKFCGYAKDLSTLVHLAPPLGIASFGVR